MTVLDLPDSIPEFVEVINSLNSSNTRHGLSGLEGSVRAFFIASAARRLRRPVLIVTHTADSAAELASGIQGWLGRPVLRFSDRDLIPFEVIAQSPDQAGERIAALKSLTRGLHDIIVTTAAALFSPVPRPQSLARSLIDLAVDDEVDIDALATTLVRLGYVAAPTADSPGEFARRGGILDINDLRGPEGLRIEWFGDQIASLRLFDRSTQRTTSRVDTATIAPVTELVLADDGERIDLIERLTSELGRMGKLKRSTLSSKAAERLRAMVDRLTQWETTGLDSLAATANPDSTLLDYLPRDALVMISNPRRVEQALQGSSLELTERLAGYLRQGHILPSQARFVSETTLMERLERFGGIDFHGIEGPGLWPRVATRTSLSSRPLPSFFGRWDMFVQELKRWLDRDGAVCIIGSSAQGADRIRAELAADDVFAASVSAGLPAIPSPRQVSIGVGLAPGGFELPTVRTIVVSDGEILGKPRKPRSVTARGQARPIESFRELKPGDFVVHASHGIGKYLGIRTLEIEGTHRDYLFVKYSGEDRLYVPTDQIQLVQKYVGGEGAEPRLNRLGGSEWARTRNRVKASVREMAQELLKLYAQRETLPGKPTGPDTPWQREFEDSFPYEETPDQARSIDETKRDLESLRPMERLLCGDVGYGKTEVALRAAFKVIMAGRQVAFLVPTTVLAHQHYRTCRERFENFPVQIEMLSRFRSPAEQKAIAERTRQGAIDLLIGTHRLLQSDIRFKNPGLIIIDEEHRFGVSHKERLKQVYPDVDALLLTATPIPRTLHMSMTGLRDMSLMETPPEDRYPVQTYVLEYDPGLVGEVIGREIARQGQVYYVYNRVETMDAARRRLASIVPEARIGVAHGQMREDELERIMLGFLDGDYDVLLCTTIIESGLDMPNVNTLIVEDADRFGLAQLYQLRGRVGRSSRLGFAYFTFRRGTILSETAEKRLAAIREFTELGSGFRLALRDLEIRGAGNLLGAEQHGFIVAVGFDMYVNLLEEAVKELKGQPIRPEAPVVKLEIGADAYLPEQYVPVAGQKMDYYRRLAAATSPDEIDELAADIVDSCGSMPPPALTLMKLGRVRVAAGRLGIAGISLRPGSLRLRFNPDATADPARIAAWAQSSPYRVRVAQGASPAVRITTPSPRTVFTIDEINTILNAWSPVPAGKTPSE